MKKNPQHPKHIESQLQQRAVAQFRSTWPEYDRLFFSVPNGGKRGKVEAAIMKGEGLVKGVADTLLLVPNEKYHGLCIEFKKIEYTYENGREHYKKGSQSKDQKIWQELVEKQGYKYAIAYDIEGFWEIINDYLGKRY